MGLESEKHQIKNNNHCSNNNRQEENNENQTKLIRLADLLERGFTPALTSPRGYVSKKLPIIQDFNPPDEGPITSTSNPGRPIDIRTAKNLRLCTFGCLTQPFPSEWRKFHFNFRKPKSDIPYGLEASANGPKSLALVVQAFVMKHLLFDETGEELRGSPKPTEYQQECALVEAFTDLLWKAAGNDQKYSQGKTYCGCAKHPEDDQQSEIEEDVDEERKVVIVLVGDKLCFKTKGHFMGDGYTERMWLYTMKKREEVKQFVKRNIHYFCCKEYPGAVMLFYSLILSHTVERVAQDLCCTQISLLTSTARSTQAFMNMMINGTATPFYHNGTLGCGCDENPRETPLHGMEQRSEVGFLYYDKSEDDKHRTEIGSMLKTPRYPIWLTMVNGVYGILFCTARDLTSDWKVERYFHLYYYNGTRAQEEQVILTIDTRLNTLPPKIERKLDNPLWEEDEEDEEEKRPSLELCIRTKWHACHIEWNHKKTLI